MSRVVRVGLSFGILTLLASLLSSDRAELVAARLIEDGVVISLGIESAIVEPGDSVTVAVTIEATDPGISEYIIDVGYDRSLVEATGCESNFGGCDPELEFETVQLYGETTDGLTGTVTLGTITFEARDELGHSELRVIVEELFDADGNQIQPHDEDVNDGRISIVRKLPVRSPTATPPGHIHTATPPSPPPPTTPPPGTQERQLTLDKQDRVKVGEQATIKVTVSRPEVSVTVPAVPGQVQVVLTTEDRPPLLIYLQPREPTLLTLKVSALNFTIEYSPAAEQEIFEQTGIVEWVVTMSPKQGFSGNQVVVVTLTQSLPEGRRLPPDVRRTYEIERFSIFIITPGKSTLDSIIDILKWALPGGLTPLITALIAFLNRRRIRDFIGRLRSSSQ